jgi:hypothetical protein
MQDPSEQIDMLEKALRCPKSLALLRMKFLEGNESGVPSFFLPTVRDSLLQWMAIVNSDGGFRIPLADADETTQLIRDLRICKQIAEMDPTLNEELGREGSHALLSKLIKMDPSCLEIEEDQDTVMEMQDIACEIASMSKSFPSRVAPFTSDELSKRLPLSFPILPATDECEKGDSEVEDFRSVHILINQVTERQSAQRDVGFGKQTTCRVVLTSLILSTVA